MKCKHCGKDSRDDTRQEAEEKYLAMQLEQEKKTPVEFRNEQEKIYKRALERGCFFWNHSKGKIAIFEPNGGGSYSNIYGSLADEIWEIVKND